MVKPNRRQLKTRHVSRCKLTAQKRSRRPRIQAQERECLPPVDRPGSPRSRRQEARKRAVARRRHHSAINTPRPANYFTIIETPPAMLTHITGISPTLALKLRALGIRQFSEIAAWDNARIHTIAEQLDIQPEQILRQAWVRQAASRCH